MRVFPKGFLNVTQHVLVNNNIKKKENQNVKLASELFGFEVKPGLHGKGLSDWTSRTLHPKLHKRSFNDRNFRLGRNTSKNWRCGFRNLELKKFELKVTFICVKF